MGPFVFPDIFNGDITNPDFTQLAAMPGAIGCVLKATDGTSYDSSWFIRNWGPLRAAGGGRAGSTWFRGAYHFLRQAETGAAQAQQYLAVLAAAGGLLDDDMMPIVDVESESSSYETWSPAAAQQIASDFAAYIYAATGRQCILYADGDIGVNPGTGFAWIWTPHTARLANWPASLMGAFQYAGDGSYYNGSSLPAQQGLPLTVPGWQTANGKPGFDFNVMMNNGAYATDIGAVATLLTGNSGFLSNIPTWFKVFGAGAVGVLAFLAYVKFMRGREPKALPVVPTATALPPTR